MNRILTIILLLILVGCAKEKEADMCNCEEQVYRAHIAVGTYAYYSHSAVFVECDRSGEETRWYDQPYNYRKVIVCP
jgi:hypothetical protein